MIKQSFSPLGLLGWIFSRILAAVIVAGVVIGLWSWLGDGVSVTDLHSFIETSSVKVEKLVRGAQEVASRW